MKSNFQKIKFPVFPVMVTSAIILFLAFYVSIRLINFCTFTFPSIFCFALYLILWFLALYFSHCLFHYIVGRLLGIKFKYVFFSHSMLSKVSIPVLSRIMSSKFMKVFMTLKLEKREKGIRYAVMFASGAIASMLFPLILSLIVFFHSRTYGEFLILLSIFNMIFTGYFSFKSGCLRKALDSFTFS